MLSRIMYISTARRLLDSTAVSTLVKHARTNNKKTNITGLLIYVDGSFLQLLEGEQKVINLLFDDIEQDSRHYHVRLLISGPIKERYFAQWSMAYRLATLRDVTETDGCEDFAKATENLESYLSVNPKGLRKANNLIQRFNEELVLSV